MRKLVQIPKKCVGCAYCVDIDPLQWEMDEDSGKAILLGASIKQNKRFIEIFDEDISFHRQVVDVCPSNCILIEN